MDNVIPMVLSVNMQPLRGVKMLLPIEIDESFLKVERLFSHVVWLGTGQFQWSIITSGTIANRTIGMTSFSIGTNRTIGTNGPSELPCTQPGHMGK